MKNYRTAFKDYLADLAKKAPSPGGGSALCLVLCLGISLLQKAISYSPQEKTKLKELSRYLNLLKRRIYSYIDLDSRLFREILKAKGRRRDRLLKESERVIIDTARECLKVVSLARGANYAIKENIKSDFYLGIEFAEVSFRGCIFNLEANKKIFGKGSRGINIFKKELAALKRMGKQRLY